MKIRLGLVCLLLTATTASAQTKEKDYATMGHGAATCGQFASDYRQVPEVEWSYFYWAQGFMSGMNFMRTRAGWVTKNIASMPIEQQESAIRQFCNDHPLSEYFEAVMDLYFSLKNSDYRSSRLPAGTDPLPSQ